MRELRWHEAMQLGTERERFLLFLLLVYFAVGPTAGVLGGKGGVSCPQSLGHPGAEARQEFEEG